MNKIQLKFKCIDTIQWLFHPWIFTMVSEIQTFAWTIHSENFAGDGNLITAFSFPNSLIHDDKDDKYDFWMVY